MRKLLIFSNETHVIIQKMSSTRERLYVNVQVDYFVNQDFWLRGSSSKRWQYSHFIEFAQMKTNEYKWVTEQTDCIYDC